MNRNQNNALKQELSSYILPPPSLLESYEEVSPGIIDKMLALAEKEQNQRHLLHKKQIKYTIVAKKISAVVNFICFAAVSMITLFISFLTLSKSVPVAVMFYLVSNFMLFLHIKKKGSATSSNALQKAPQDIANQSDLVPTPQHHRKKLRKRRYYPTKKL